MAATVTTRSITTNGAGNVEVLFDVRTSAGRLEVPITVEDMGNTGANEDQARRELLTLAQELVDALRWPGP